MLSVVKKNNLSRAGSSRDLYFGPFADRRVAAFHIKKKKRNLFVTVTDITGAVVSSVSAKFFAANRKKRFAPHVIDLIIRQLAMVLKAYRIVTLRLFIKFPKAYLVKAAVRTLKSCGVIVTVATDLVAVAHNGCRKKKRRRL